MAFALGLLFLGFFRRPAEGQAQQFTPAHFAGGFHHQAIFAGRQVLERRLAVIEHQAVAADRTGRAADSVHRHLEAATATAPPFAHVLEPFLAFVVLQLQVVPDGEVGDVALVGLLQPQSHVGAVILGDLQAGDFHIDLQLGCHQRCAEQGEREQQAFTHDTSLMNEQQRQ